VRNRDNDSLAADTQRLDSGIRQLKVQYDMFFAGALAKPPLELRTKLENIILRQSRSGKGSYQERFHFNGLVSRFSTLCELWGRNQRSMEEGNQRHAGLLDKFEIRERLLARCQVKTPEEAVPEIRRLYNRYVDAKNPLGENRRPLSFEKFMHSVTLQTDRLRQSAGCDQIELRLVVRDDKVQLKARPGR
jgi:hypothetical protein